jgi:soluble lytic murein transglycosylase-like protein
MNGLSKIATVLLLMAVAACAHAADVAVLRNGFEIPHARHEQSGDSTRLYFSAGADSGYVDVPTGDIAEFRHEESAPTPPATTANNNAPGSANPDIKALVSAASNRHLVDPDLITSVIRAESNFNPKARSPKGAQGLMQLMPGTASRLGVDDAYAAEANVDAGTRYLRELLQLYDGDLIKALAAYNAGPHRVDQYGGVPPYQETHAYVARIVREFNRKKLEQQRAARAAKLQPTTHKEPAASRHPSKPAPGKATATSGAAGN